MLEYGPRVARAIATTALTDKLSERDRERAAQERDRHAVEARGAAGDDAVKQQAKIDFMRRRNADRVKRLLNSKQRAIGADPAALARQIQEREEAKLEEQEDLSIEQQTARQSEVLGKGRERGAAGGHAPGCAL